MTRTSPRVYRGFQGSFIYGDRTGIFYAQMINLRKAMIPFRFRRIADFTRPLRGAVDAYLADCRLAGLRPEKPVRPTAAERTKNRRVAALLRKPLGSGTKQQRRSK